MPEDSPVGVPEDDGSVALALDEQLAAMAGTMVRRAQGQQVRRLVTAAF